MAGRGKGEWGQEGMEGKESLTSQSSSEPEMVNPDYSDPCLLGHMLF